MRKLLYIIKKREQLKKSFVCFNIQLCSQWQKQMFTLNFQHISRIFQCVHLCTVTTISDQIRQTILLAKVILDWTSTLWDNRRKVNNNIKLNMNHELCPTNKGVTTFPLTSIHNTNVGGVRIYWTKYNGPHARNSMTPINYGLNILIAFCLKNTIFASQMQ